MTVYRGQQAYTPKLSTSSYGNAWNDDNKIDITAALVAADEVILMEIPAGTRLTGLKYRAGDLDSGATLVANLGYRSTHPEQRVAAAPSYFLNASAAFQAAQNGWVDLAFEPITFQENVQIVLKPTAPAVGLPAATAIWAIASGRVVGVA
ncbi:MAG: hypothetical protein WAQ08_16115 [Aquabacterium sp.]|uniref:hypothetical protein n=1 Tax=Aquabacterium sp. TaxID=1872578 RepID=UPI003BB1088B